MLAMPSALRTSLSSTRTIANSSPQARDGHCLAERHPQPVGHALEQEVAGIMPERIIDVLEVVEVEEQEREARLRPLRLLEGPLHQPLEGGPVEQPGERIVRGRVA